jgi:hypothetical protein
MNTKTLAKSNLAALVSATLLAACATAPASKPPVAQSVPQESVPAHLSRVYLYARHGQSPEQQDRDRFECFNWAAKQTGFDPSRYAAPRDDREQFVPAPPAGVTILAGTVTGALVGAAVSAPWDREEGAVSGAIAGTALGAVTASAEARAIRTAHQEPAARSSYEQQAVEHRRAMSACLEGRGYVVK